MKFDYGWWYFGVRWAGEWAWFYPFNWLATQDRYWGRGDMYHDGPLPTFGLWFFNISWRW
jgi:hypothetical protein